MSGIALRGLPHEECQLTGIHLGWRWLFLLAFFLGLGCLGLGVCQGERLGSLAQRLHFTHAALLRCFHLSIALSGSPHHMCAELGDERPKLVSYIGDPLKQLFKGFVDPFESHELKVGTTVGWAGRIDHATYRTDSDDCVREAALACLSLCHTVPY